MIQKSISKGLILSTVIVMDLLSGMEFDLFVPSFPQLQHQFNLTPSWVEALLSINFIGYFLSLYIVGGLADRFGRKPIILLGLIIFIIGSLLCLAQQSFYFLLLGRFIQGIGIAAPAILSFLIIADTYPLKEQQFLMGVLNGAINIAVAISPVIGSYLTLYFNWQGNFIALLLLGIVTFLMVVAFVPYYKIKTSETTLSLNGYTVILHSKPLMLLIIYILFMIVPYWIFVGMSPLLYIKSLKVSLAHFGYYQGVLAFVFAIGSIIYGLIIRKFDFDPRKILMLALKVTVLSLITVALAAITNNKNPFLLTLAFLPFVVSQIIPCVILYPLALNFLPEVKARVSAVIQGARLILTALGLQLTGYLYTGTFQSLGSVLAVFILMASITLFLVIKNENLWKHYHSAHLQ